MLSSEGSPEMNMLTFACKDDAKGVADYLSKCARICLHQQRASPAPKILSNMSKNQVLKEVVGLLCIVVLQMVRDDLFIHIMDIFSAESIHLHPIVFDVERSKGMLEENLSSMAYLKTFSAWTKERMRKALLGVHYWIQQPTFMACFSILWEFDRIWCRW